MSRIAFLLVATTALVACPRPGTPDHPEPSANDRAIRVRVAQAEARRGGGVSDLLDIATHGARDERVLALRGLGRTGGPQALAALRAALHDPEALVVVAAAAAIGVSALLDEAAPADTAASDDVGGELARALPIVPAAVQPVVIEAIGRAADPRSEPALLAQLHGAAPNAEAAALALGRFGRRKLPWSPGTREAITALTASADAKVRYAAVYALSREQLAAPAPPPDHALVAPLVARVADEDPQIRALAVLALDKHALITDAHAALEHALLDRDWRVAVAAVNALTGKHGDDAGRDAVAAALVRRATELERGTASEAQVVLAGLEALAPFGARPLVITAVTAIGTRSAASTTLPELTRGWIGCRAQVVVQHGSPAPDLAAVQGCTLPDHLRLPLVAELVKDKVGTLAQRRSVLGALLVHKDVRVRAAALGALPALWSEGDDADHRAAIATLVSALASPDPILAGAAVDATGELYDAIGTNEPALDASLLARAAHTTEHDVAAQLLELVGKRTLAGGAEVCRAGLTSHPIRAKAARSCLSAFGEAVPAPPPGPLTPPPIDLGVLHPRLRWHLTTTRGDIVIALREDVAPWAVATIVTLTRRGFYDGLELHRVVPGFVVQGGDPTMSGAGGPGFEIPAEPGSLADGPGFVTGGVGIADSGRDSGGSQWFAMHARAPHLDGRYTWIGELESGQKSADALLIGDKVLHATIDAAP